MRGYVDLTREKPEDIQQAFSVMLARELALSQLQLLRLSVVSLNDFHFSVSHDGSDTAASGRRIRRAFRTILKAVNHHASCRITLDSQNADSLNFSVSILN